MNTARINFTVNNVGVKQIRIKIHVCGHVKMLQHSSVDHCPSALASALLRGGGVRGSRI